jgi:O-antigen/teichoic acid export membrane protein
MSSLYTNNLTIILGIVSGTQQVGILSGADKIRRPVQSLLSPISMVFYPRMSFLAMDDLDKALYTSLNLLRIQGAMSFLLSASLTVCAPIAVDILLGSGFEQASTTLQILSWVIFFTGVGGVLGPMIMLPFGMKREFTICIFVGAMVGLGSAVPLSIYAGAVGAATGAVCSEAAVALAMYAIVARRFPTFRPLRTAR